MLDQIRVEQMFFDTGLPSSLSSGRRPNSKSKENPELPYLKKFIKSFSEPFRQLPPIVSAEKTNPPAPPPVEFHSLQNKKTPIPEQPNRKLIPPVYLKAQRSQTSKKLKQGGQQEVTNKQTDFAIGFEK